MEDTQLEDLKQFIDGRFSQSETLLKEDLGEKINATEKRLEEKIDKKIDSLRDEMLDGFTGVGEAIEEINNRIDQLDTSKSPA